MDEVPLSVSEFVAYLNQTLEYAFPRVLIKGEVSEFRVSKNRWVYFNLKDQDSSIKCFGTVYQMPGPLQDGMVVQVLGSPRLHNLYGFSVNVQAVQPVGEGSLKKAFELLRAKLEAEGLFAPSRKRSLPELPSRIGLISSTQAAGYTDFVTILGARWGGIEVMVADTQVQGISAPRQIVRAIEYFNTLDEPPEVLVIVRGGGSADDLAAFNDEALVRAVASSKIPTLVGIGHEVDVSLADLAADVRAATPSNAAERLTPDRREILERLAYGVTRLDHRLATRLGDIRQSVAGFGAEALKAIQQKIIAKKQYVLQQARLLEQLSPNTVLEKGYALLRQRHQVLKGRAIRELREGDSIEIDTKDFMITAGVKHVAEK